MAKTETCECCGRDLLDSEQCEYCGHNNYRPHIGGWTKKRIKNEIKQEKLYRPNIVE